MRKIAVVLSSSAHDAIATAQVLDDFTGIRLVDPNLPRDVYEEVAEALKRAGFKWHRHKKAHLVNDDVSVDEALSRLGVIRETGVAPAKNPDCWFPTQPAIARRVADKAREWYSRSASSNLKTPLVLEPSAGEGSLLKALSESTSLAKYTNVRAVERDPDRADYLQRRLKGQFSSLFVACEDYLNYTNVSPYDIILMNPPFDGGQAGRHIVRAWGMLADGGRLVAIAPASAPTSEHAIGQLIRDPAPGTASWEPLPDDAFVDSGTGTSVRTILLTLDRP